MNTQAASQCCFQDMSGLHSRTLPRTLRLIAMVDWHCRVVQHCSTESSIRRTSGHNVGLPARYRLSTADTCFVMSSALRGPWCGHPPDCHSLAPSHAAPPFARSGSEVHSTCLSLHRPSRCVTPKAALAPLYTTVLHDSPTSRITD